MSVLQTLENLEHLGLGDFEIREAQLVYASSLQENTDSSDG